MNNSDSTDHFIEIPLDTDTYTEDQSELTNTIISDEQSEEGDTLLIFNKKIRSDSTCRTNWEKRNKSETNVNHVWNRLNYSATDIETFKNSRVEDIIIEDTKTESKTRYIWNRGSKRKKGVNFKTMFVRRRTRSARDN